MSHCYLTHSRSSICAEGMGVTCMCVHLTLCQYFDVHKYIHVTIVKPCVTLLNGIRIRVWIYKVRGHQRNLHLSSHLRRFRRVLSCIEILDYPLGVCIFRRRLHCFFPVWKQLYPFPTFTPYITWWHYTHTHRHRHTHTPITTNTHIHTHTHKNTHPHTNSHKDTNKHTATHTHTQCQQQQQAIKKMTKSNRIVSAIADAKSEEKI